MSCKTAYKLLLIICWAIFGSAVAHEAYQAESVTEIVGKILYGVFGFGVIFCIWLLGAPFIMYADDVKEECRQMEEEEQRILEGRGN